MGAAGHSDGAQKQDVLSDRVGYQTSRHWPEFASDLPPIRGDACDYLVDVLQRVGQHWPDEDVIQSVNWQGLTFLMWGRTVWRIMASFVAALDLDMF